MKQDKRFEGLVEAVREFVKACEEAGLKPPKEIRMDYDDKGLKMAVERFRLFKDKNYSNLVEPVRIYGVLVRFEDNVRYVPRET